MAGISTGQFYESVLWQLCGWGQGQTDAYPLWLQKSQLCHHFIYTFYADATRSVHPPWIGAGHFSTAILAPPFQRWDISAPPYWRQCFGARLMLKYWLVRTSWPASWWSAL